MRDVKKYELIGLDIEIVGSRNKSQLGLKGKIIDETKNTFIIETKNKTKTVFKKDIIIKVKMKQKQIRIDGKLLVGRPEERIKK